MEKRINFLEDMDVGPADLVGLQGYAQEALDHVVADAITGGRRYSGFAAAATNLTTLTVKPGRLYSGGLVFAADQDTVFDVTTRLPVATRKIVSLAIFGDEVDTGQTTREFLLNEETGASEPRAVALLRARLCNVNLVYGVEAADPVAPIVPPGALVVAQILLSPAGILSITPVADNALDSVATVAQRAKALEDFRGKAEPQIGSLASDIASLTAGQSRLVDKEVYGRALGRLATIEAKTGIPAAAVDSRADFFLDGRYSDPTFAGYSARVREGIRFPDTASAVTALALLSPLDAAARVVNGLLLPAYSSKLRQSVGPATGEVRAQGFTYANNTVVQRTMSRTRLTYGSSQTVCTNSAWWQSGTYDPLSGIFRINGETWTVDPADRDKALGHYFIRTTQFWQDSYEEPYWDVVTTSTVVPGTQIAQTFLQANDMWLESVGLTFRQLGANGAVTIAIAETDRGLPMLDKVIAKTTIDRAALQVGYNKLALQPTFLVGGKRYAIVVITAGDHFLGIVEGNVFPSGTFFYVLDGAYQQGDATKDLAFDLYGCEFASARAAIELGALSLNGGIATIDIIAPAVVPGSCQLSYEIQVNGVWYPLAKADQLVLGAGGNMPNLVRFRAVFSGTPDVMPGVSLTGSQVTVSRAATTRTWVSSVRNLPGSGSTAIRVSARLEAFNAARHTTTIALLTGAGYATVVAASSVVDTLAPDGTIERTWLFNLGSAVTSFRIREQGTTDSPLSLFHAAWLKDWAL